MKFRSDFVTNSSSSSFLIAFHSKEEGIETIIKMSQRYGSMFVDRLLEDFETAKSFSINDIADHHRDEVEGDAEYETDSYRHSWRSCTPTFRELWDEAHPDATKEDWYASKERADRIKVESQKQIENMIQAVAGREYLVELEYEDHDPIGSELEHEIMPNQDFTVWRFSHH